MGKRGPAPGSGGRPRKPLADKIIEGNRSHRKTEVIDFGEKTPVLEGVAMPKPHEMLSATQRDGTTLQAKEIYEVTWKWLNERKCVSLISPQLLERYSMVAARWIHCEQTISSTGYLAKHPVSGNAVQSPFVSMSIDYMKQTNRLWGEIFNIVRENCTTEFSGASPQDDMMERLLSARRN